MSTKSLAIPKELHRSLSILAAQQGRRIGEAAEQAIVEYIERQARLAKADKVLAREAAR